MKWLTDRRHRAGPGRAGQRPARRAQRGRDHLRARAPERQRHRGPQEAVGRVVRRRGRRAGSTDHHPADELHHRAERAASRPAPRRARCSTTSASRCAIPTEFVQRWREAGREVGPEFIGARRGCPTPTSWPPTASGSSCRRTRRCTSPSPATTSTSSRRSTRSCWTGTRRSSVCASGPAAAFESTTDVPGMNMSFGAGSVDEPVATQGRSLDHIGFEVDDLEAFCERLAAMGIEFDVEYHEVDSTQTEERLSHRPGGDLHRADGRLRRVLNPWAGPVMPPAPAGSRGSVGQSVRNRSRCGPRGPSMSGVTCVSICSRLNHA